MFTVFVRIRKKALVIAACALLVVAGGLIGLSSLLSAEEEMPASGQRPNLALNKADKNENRVNFLKNLGWEVEEEPIEIEEVLIPKEFDAVFQRYNELQIQQGFDLTKQQGKRVKRYSYAITNYPGQKEAVRANLLVYKNKLIGGDVCSNQLDGFMHGLVMPTSS